MDAQNYANAENVHEHQVSFFRDKLINEKTVINTPLLGNNRFHVGRYKKKLYKLYSNICLNIR